MSNTRSERNKAIVLEALDGRGRGPVEGRNSGRTLGCVTQDQPTKEQSKSGNPMFGDGFPK
jgi:hypothetical protein